MNNIFYAPVNATVEIFFFRIITLQNDYNYYKTSLIVCKIHSIVSSTNNKRVFYVTCHIVHSDVTNIVRSTKNSI